MFRTILATLLFSLLSISNVCSKDILYKMDLTSKSEYSLWSVQHFRGQVSITSNITSAGVVLNSKGTGKTVNSFNRKIKKNGETKLGVQLKLASHVKKLPLLVCLSARSGCCLPTIKKKPFLDAGEEFQTIDFVYDTESFPDGDFVIEFIIDGKVPEGKLITVKGIEIFEVPAPPLELTQSPSSGFLYNDKKMSNEIRLNWDFNTQPADLTFKLIHDGETLKSQESNKADTGTVKFDLSEFENGNYKVDIFIADKLCKTCDFNKIPMQKNSFIIQNRTPYLNGKPYFAIGLFHTGDTTLDKINPVNEDLGIPEVTRTEMLKQVRARNFNTVHSSWWTASKDFYKEAATFGLNVLSESKRDIEKVAAIKNEPNSLGYYIFDEPKPEQYNECSNIYERFKKIDPYHPAIIAFCRKPTQGSESKLMDIAMVDPYPIKNAESNVDMVIKYIINARKHLHNFSDDTCEFSVNQLFYLSGRSYTTIPTIHQAKAEVYAALVGGAKGIFYYAYWTHEEIDVGMPRNPKRKNWFLPDSILWDQIGEVNAEIAKYSDFFLLGAPAPKFTVKGVNNARSWRLGNKVLLLAVNTSGSKSDRGTIKFPAGWKSDTPCSNGGGIRMKPYETRKWLFQLDK